jgi:hypothetical protein
MACLGRLARLAMQQGLAEMQLGVVGVDAQALGTRVQGRDPGVIR